MKDLFGVIVFLVCSPIVLPWFALRDLIRKRQAIKFPCPNCGGSFAKTDLTRNDSGDENGNGHDDFILMPMPTYNLQCSLCKWLVELDHKFKQSDDHPIRGA